MRPKREPEQPQREMFEVELEQMIDLSHPLVWLGKERRIIPRKGRRASPRD